MPGRDDDTTSRDDALERATAGDRRAAARIATRLRDGDADLLDEVAREAAAGSPVALDLLLTAIDDLGHVRAAVRRIIVASAAVDDVAQEVLITVASKISTYRGEARFTTWLYQVAKYKGIDHLRRQRDTDTLDEHEGLEAARLSSIIATRASIRQAVDALPEHYRDAVVLRDLQQLSYQEVAERLDVPLNTARTRIARGRALLAATLAEHDGPGDG